MTYLLDTNLVSELRKPRRTMDAGVRTWTDAQSPADMWLSVITVMELEIGIARLERRDAAQGLVLRRWLGEAVMPAFDRRILPVDLLAARATATMHVPDPRPERDALIAGIAAARGLTVVTRNVSDFRALAVPTLNPWTL